MPSSALLHLSAERADALVHLDIANRTDFRVQIVDASVSFLDGGRVLETIPLGKDFFKDPVTARSARIDAGRRAKWSKICFDAVPAEADSLRFDLELRRRKIRSRQSAAGVLEPQGELARLRLPFAGFWGVSQGHTCDSNHRVNGFGGEFAWDFAAVGPDGRPENDAYEKSRRNEDTYAFGRPVLAPASGVVVKIVDDLSDNDGIKRYPRRSILDINARPDWNLGNFVVIDAGRDAFVLLGHLRSGSVAVRPGQVVQLGDLIAQCGNSGNSIAPHIHVQVMDRPDPAHPEVRGLPAEFREYDQFSTLGHGASSELEARRITFGDPPQGVIVSPVD